MELQTMKPLFFILLLSLLTVPEKHHQTVISRSYCTEIGRFEMLFDEDEVSGSYSLIPKNSLGAIWGKLKGNTMTGRWVDGDGRGEIIITFNHDFSWFTTQYRSDKHPETWYDDSWHGALRPEGKSVFERDGKTYRCE